MQTAYQTMLRQPEESILMELADIQSEISNLQFSNNAPKSQLQQGIENIKNIDKRLNEIQEQIVENFLSRNKKTIKEYSKTKHMVKLKESNINLDLVARNLFSIDSLIMEKYEHIKKGNIENQESDTKSWQENIEKTLNISVECCVETDKIIKFVENGCEEKEFAKEIDALKEKLSKVETLITDCSRLVLRRDLVKEKQGLEIKKISPT